MTQPHGSTEPGSFPGWCGPILGPILFAGMGYYCNYEYMKGENALVFILAFAGCGLLAGLIVWAIDANKKSGAGKD